MCLTVFGYEAYSHGEVRLGLAYIVANKSDPFIKIITVVCHSVVAEAKAHVKTKETAEQNAAGDASIEEKLQTLQMSLQGTSVSTGDELADYWVEIRSFAGRLEQAGSADPHWCALLDVFIAVSEAVLRGAGADVQQTCKHLVLSEDRRYFIVDDLANKQLCATTWAALAEKFATELKLCVDQKLDCKQFEEIKVLVLASPKYNSAKLSLRNFGSVANLLVAVYKTVGLINGASALDAITDVESLCSHMASLKYELSASNDISDLNALSGQLRENLLSYIGTWGVDLVGPAKASFCSLLLQDLPDDKLFPDDAVASLATYNNIKKPHHDILQRKNNYMMLVSSLGVGMTAPYIEWLYGVNSCRLQFSAAMKEILKIGSPDSISSTDGRFSQGRRVFIFMLASLDSFRM